MNEFDKRTLPTLLGKLLRGAVVPFVGSGISNGARWPGSEGGGAQYHRVGEMVKALAGALYEHELQRGGLNLCSSCASCLEKCTGVAATDAAGDTRGNACPACWIGNAYRQQSLTQLCDGFIWSLPGANRPPDGDAGICALSELTRLLKIAEFRNLPPTRAHYCLAMLAREGLIEEILTTNYDCAFERAYAATWGEAWPAAPGRVPIAVIDTLWQFTHAAGKRHERRPGDDTRRYLKLYKLNGCAQQLHEDEQRHRGSEPRYAENILLTGTQLQQWRKRQWAADLFRSKYRSSSLVFIGFGSDEAQIHHTVRAVLEEYQQERPAAAPVQPTAAAGGHDTLLCEQINAPFVTIYEPTPSFPQRQIVEGYAEISRKRTQAPSLIISAKNLSCWLSEPAVTDAKLDANELWLHVFRYVLASLMIEAVEHAGRPERASFTGLVPGADQLFARLASRWRKALGEFRPTFTDPVLALLAGDALDQEETVYLPRIGHLLAHLRGMPCGSGACPDMRYAAITDHPDTVAEIAFIIDLLLAAGVTDLAISPVAAQRILITGALRAAPVALLLAPASTRPGACLRLQRHWDGNIAEIVLGGRSSADRTTRLLAEPAAADECRYGRVVRISWRDIDSAGRGAVRDGRGGASLRARLAAGLAALLVHPHRYAVPSAAGFRRRPDFVAQHRGAA